MLYVRYYLFIPFYHNNNSTTVFICPIDYLISPINNAKTNEVEI